MIAAIGNFDNYWMWWSIRDENLVAQIR